MNNSLIKNGLLVVAIVAVGSMLLVYKAPTPVKEPVASVLYTCRAGKGFSVVFYKGSNTAATTSGQPPKPDATAVLTFSDGTTTTLVQTISADGGRYANADESLVFWGKGNYALVLEGGKEVGYIGCIVIAPATAELPVSYSNSADRFSIRLPAGYTLNEQYRYTELGPKKEIAGIKFVIASTTAAGTNLSPDSYVSVEGIPLATSTLATDCSASLFVSGAKPQTVNDGQVTYSFAATMGAAAGNRYEEAVFALPGTNPCIAMRYFIHSTVFENYPAGTVKQFDEKALVAQFDAMRHTLIIAQ